MPHTILLIERDERRRRELAATLEYSGQQVLVADGILRDDADWQEQFETALAPEDVGLLLLAGGLSPQEQGSLLSALQKWGVDAPLVSLRDPATTSGSAAELRRVVAGELFLPLRQAALEELLASLERRRGQGSLWARRDVEQIGRRLAGSSALMGEVRKQIGQVACSDANVLILGESGTGKEVVARCIHDTSGRFDKPFVPVNCGGFTPELIESELFGHEKGAFTGAYTSRQGRFEIAEGGTLFLDEIGEMPLPMQVKLLRVIQERVFERVGGSRSLAANVRIIAATHRNLEELIDEGRFREDLYYRLNVFPIEVPPLRLRSSDIQVLIEVWNHRLQQRNYQPVRFTSRALECLARHDWPGNVRELGNLMERLVITHSGAVVDALDLPQRLRGDLPAAVSVVEPEASPLLPPGGIDLKEHLSLIEQALIRQALEQSDEVVAQAAQLLGLRRTTLVEKIRKYRI